MTKYSFLRMKCVRHVESVPMTYGNCNIALGDRNDSTLSPTINLPISIPILTFIKPVLENNILWYSLQKLFSLVPI